jgi:hypothetical protein
VGQYREATRNIQKKKFYQQKPPGTISLTVICQLRFDYTFRKHIDRINRTFLDLLSRILKIKLGPTVLLRSEYLAAKDNVR